MSSPCSGSSDTVAAPGASCLWPKSPQHWPSTASRPGRYVGVNNQDVLCRLLCMLPSGVFGVAKMLGLYQPPESYWYTDNMTLSASKTLNPHPSAVSGAAYCAYVQAPAASCSEL
jgi:hypothetical protein